MELKINGISKQYGTIKALDNFSVTLTDGVYGLLGPNGSGKTTLIRIITDSINSDSGEILFNGKDIKELGVSFRSFLGYMPQHHGIYPSFTATQYLSYIGSLKALGKNEIHQQVLYVLKAVNLLDVANRSIGALSGGMKQRLMLAQALIGNPKLIILDEPTAGLDPKERIRIRNLISGFALNRIVIIATHVVSDVEYIAKEIMLIRKGRLIYHDTPDRLCKSLENKVFEIETYQENLDKVLSQYEVCNIHKSTDSIIVRILLNENQNEQRDMCGYDYKRIRASVEDVYLSVFDEERETELVK
ncbi:MAG: ATP-binding cassette domain-containing protein [Clostridia bacterium]|jgi:ABC-type multidrug transport system ATPase subunit|nr:ATP-binding cassette domain-containing protein [Clostridia bacterium]